MDLSPTACMMAFAIRVSASIEIFFSWSLGIVIKNCPFALSKEYIVPSPLDVGFIIRFDSSKKKIEFFGSRRHSNRLLTNCSRVASGASVGQVDAACCATLLIISAVGACGGGGSIECHKFILKRISFILSQKRGVLSIFLYRKKLFFQDFPPPTPNGRITAAMCCFNGGWSIRSKAATSTLMGKALSSKRV